MERPVTIRPPLAFPLFAALLAGMVFAAGASAQTYPNRTITFVVPFAAGGLSDVPARVLAAEMQERIGQSIVVENKPRAAGGTRATPVWRAGRGGATPPRPPPRAPPNHPPLPPPLHPRD